MKIKYFLAFLSVFALQFSACKKNKENGTVCIDGSANFTHLGVGHELKYVFYSSSSADDTMLIKNNSTDSNGTYKSFISFLPSNKTSEVFYHACNKDLFISTNNNIDQYGHSWLSLDANIGDTWTRTIDNKRYTYMLYSKNDSITTPVLNQNFTACYKFSYQGSSSFFDADTIYFKPDIGIVYYHGTLSSYELFSKNF
jgi:hypothetical protein